MNFGESYHTNTQIYNNIQEEINKILKLWI